MLRVAVPNKGSLAETAALMLKEAGYKMRRDAKQLVFVDAANKVEFFYLRPRDIATYVGSGSVDLGITGRDLLLDSESEAKEILDLDFAKSTFRFASPINSEISSINDLEDKKIATSYPKLVNNFLIEHNIKANLVRLEGAVESSVRLGVADAIADVVETGGTLKAAALEIFGPEILFSSAILISAPEPKSSTETLLRRIKGVLVARKYVLMDYDLPSNKLDEAVKIASGIESPTVSSLQDPDWLAVRVMIPRDSANNIMDRLYDIGARAILVTAIHAARI